MEFCMEFCKLGLNIGVAITIVTIIVIALIYRNPDIYTYNKVIQFTIHLLIMISIVMTGGMFLGNYIGYLATKLEDLFFFIWGIVAAIIIFIVIGILYYLIVYYFLLRFKILFAFIYIFSIIGWSIANYYYQCNIETITQYVVESQTERKLLNFCNIPLQNVSVEISGSSILNSRSIEITTSDNLPYWYLNEKGEGIYDFAPVTASKIAFIDDNQSPYLEIVVYSTKTTVKNHNNGTEKTTADDGRYAQYIFYLPKEIMQYNLN